MPHNDTPRDGDAKLIEILATVHRHCDKPICPECACLREIARLRAAQPATDAAAERDRIVAWLRLEALAQGNDDIAYMMHKVADAIERGEHAQLERRGEP